MILTRLGNKRRIAAKILPHIPDHKLWLEPFFGAGGLFFSKQPAQRSIVNDLDGEVYNLFCVILDRSAELEEAWYNTPIHEDLWKHWKKEMPDDPVWRAVRFLLQSNFGFLGKPQTLQWNKKNAKRLLQERIATTRELLYDVEFMNCDFRNMLRRIPMSKNERANAFLYADPPYLGTDNNYGRAAAWCEQDTGDLFTELLASGLRFAISEFDNPVVLELAKEHDLRTIIIGERHNLRNRRTEIIITNVD
ncbi:MAG: DNA adenine methylase [Flavobacteriales bacterium]|nr:DNA adenine methylase [Flavobacteriales bacterium]